MHRALLAMTQLLKWLPAIIILSAYGFSLAFPILALTSSFTRCWNELPCSSQENNVAYLSTNTTLPKTDFEQHIVP